MTRLREDATDGQGDDIDALVAKVETAAMFRVKAAVAWERSDTTKETARVSRYGKRAEKQFNEALRALAEAAKAGRK